MRLGSGHDPPHVLQYNILSSLTLVDATFSLKILLITDYNINIGMNGKWETKQLKVTIYFQEINKKSKKTSQLYAGDPDGGVLAAAGQEVVLGPGAELEPGHRGLVPAQHLQGGPGGASLYTQSRYIVVKINREYR